MGHCVNAVFTSSRAKPTVSHMSLLTQFTLFFMAEESDINSLGTDNSLIAPAAFSALSTAAAAMT